MYTIYSLYVSRIRVTTQVTEDLHLNVLLVRFLETAFQTVIKGAHCTHFLSVCSDAISNILLSFYGHVSAFGGFYVLYYTFSDNQSKLSCLAVSVCESRRVRALIVCAS